MESLFTALCAEGLTTLKIRYDFRTDKFRFTASRDWDADIDFSQYNKAFYVQSILTDDAFCLGTAQVRAMFEKHGMLAYFNKILDLVRQGKHFGVDILYFEKFNVRYICGIHNIALGLKNKSRAALSGATRRHGFDDDEMDVIIDVLNLSRAMSFKSVAANIKFGGCKAAVHMDPLDMTNMEIMGFLAYACDCIRHFTGPDMNLPKGMVTVMNEHFTSQYAGGEGSPLGDSAVPTAYGVYLAMKQAVRFRSGSESLDGMSISIQGLGAVGYATAEHLTKEKTKLFITDLRPEIVERFIKEHPGHDITPVPLDDILKVDADILCPCAKGGILGEQEIADIKFQYVFGPANNQLRASSQDEEIRLAKLLDERGILFQTEWWHNCAGALGASMDYLYGSDMTPSELEKKVEEILPVQTWKNLNLAKEQGITPTECAYKSCQELVYNATAFPASVSKV